MAAAYKPEATARSTLQSRKWRAANKERASELAREWRDKHPEQTKVTNRNSKIKKAYGLSPEQYDAKLLEQGGVCAICRETCATGHALCVDHNHTTNAVRGLLCKKHNTMISYANEDISTLEAAIAYLRKYGA
jgi:hypothetical protein